MLEINDEIKHAFEEYFYAYEKFIESSNEGTKYALMMAIEGVRLFCLSESEIDFYCKMFENCDIDNDMQKI